MRDLLESLRDEAARRKAEFADVRAVERESANIFRQDGRADRLSQGKSLGVGIRVLKDGAWGFAAVTGCEKQSATECLDSAVAMAEASQARVEQRAAVASVEPVVDSFETPFEIDPRSVSLDRKMKALADYESAALEVAGDKAVNTIFSYSDAAMVERVANTFGTYVESRYVRTFLYAMVVAKDGEVRQRGSERIGKLAGFELVEQTDPKDLSVKAANNAVALLSAELAPSGKFPVVFHPSITGLLTHEAIGHNAEADLVTSGGSIVEGKLGDKLASEFVTIVDDGTIGGSWGSYKYDSEGVPSRRRVLIRNGVLVDYLQSLETAAKLGMQPNGSARAQDYHSRPVVRMSNTFIEPRSGSFEDIIKGIDLGVFLKGGEWGYVFCERGQFTCHAGEGYMIRNGALAEHLRDVSVSGMTLETLANIEAVSGDFEMMMPGMCGKEGQGMPINAGGPYVRIKELVVGGRKAV